MMKKLVHIFPLLFVSVLCSQKQDVSGDIMDTSAYLENLTNPIYDEIQGSPYLQETFVPAKINDGTETKFVRFNPVDNTIEINLGNSQMMTLSKTTTYLIELLDGSNKVYQTLSYLNEGGQKDISFFEKIHEEEFFTLYLKERIKLVRGVKDQQAYGGEKPDRFLKVNDVYYITNFRDKTPDILVIPRKKKDFFKWFQKRDKEIEKFVKEKKLDINSPSGLVEVFAYYLGAKK